MDIEKRRAYDRKRANNPERVAARLAYAATEAGRMARRRANSAYSKRNPRRVVKWRKGNPIKTAAHWTVGSNLLSGKLKKKPCERCGNLRSHAHHEELLLDLSTSFGFVRCITASDIRKCAGTELSPDPAPVQYWTTPAPVNRLPRLAGQFF